MNSFQFLDFGLQRQLLDLVRMRKALKWQAAGSNPALPVMAQAFPKELCTIGSDWILYYQDSVKEEVENELISSIRTRRFSLWQLLMFPQEDSSMEAYRQYMGIKQIPHYAEVCNGELNFLLPRNFKPLLWKLPDLSEY